MWVDLHRKVALVTGASRGIGRAIARALAGAGAAVAVNYKESESAAKETIREIEERGGTAVLWQADVRDGEAVRAMVEGIVDRFGRLDILVNNAGIIRDALLLQMPEDDWEAVLATNLIGVYRCAKAAAKYMMLQKWGRIISISSVAAWRGNRGQCHYAAAKGGVNAFTRALAAELAPKGITVNAIAPGLIVTDMTRGLLPFAEGVIRDRIAMRRAGTPEDVAPLAVFLASEQAAYITGQVITVDGGMF
ncbi:MAG: 3-oxoacyl-[acyl-carrier-protein] reductase [candidate division NC10 bacterium]|nr:3-oxoacyl-[acyl-carrier-protein] reductase [candidate division NC10 bacterium]